MTNSIGQGGSALTLEERKQAARGVAISSRAFCDPAVGCAVGRLIIPHVGTGDVVAGYFPMDRELDIRPLLLELRGRGQIIALPRTPGRGKPLTFHRWGERDALERERYGTMTSTGPAVQPSLLLVPLLAFDRRGQRLGYGGGYYDRTLSAMPGVRTIGCAYARLELAEVPTSFNDMALDAIATETEFITIKALISKAGPCASSS